MATGSLLRIVQPWSAMSDSLPPLVLVRTAPNKTVNKVYEHLIDPRIIGDDEPLGDAVPRLFRILASPDAPVIYPRAPKPADPL